MSSGVMGSSRPLAPPVCHQIAIQRALLSNSTPGMNAMNQLLGSPLAISANIYAFLF